MLRILWNPGGNLIEGELNEPHLPLFYKTVVALFVFITHLTATNACTHRNIEKTETQKSV